MSARIRLWDLVVTGGVVASGATVLGFLGDQWWFFDLFSHFRVQYCLGLAAVALVLLFRRACRTPAIFGLMAAVNLATIMPLYWGTTPQPSPKSRVYRALLVNVNTRSGDPVRVAACIQQVNPDFVVLEEVSEQWLDSLAPALTNYSCSETAPREDNFGIALFSKYAFTCSAARELGEAEVPTITAELTLAEGPLTLIATHPLPPAGAEYARLRDDQLRQLAVVANQASSPVLLLGDLNTTPWSPHFQRLLSRSGLRDSSRGRGVLATWPAHLPLLLIPLDHCLHSSEILVSRKALGPKVGSDHYPLVVEFGLAE